MIMRFRPANIRLINRRSNLPRLLLALSSGSDTENEKQYHRFGSVDTVTPYQGNTLITTWLIENEENVKVAKEVLRHAWSGTILDVYAKAVTQSKRRTQEKIVNQLLAARQNDSNPAGFEFAGTQK
jgi:hypothetical protein